LYGDADSLGKKLVEHHFAHGFVGTVHNINNTVTKGSFQIKLDQSDSHLHLKEAKKDADQRWNMKHNRFMNSSKAGQNYYVFAGDAQASGASSLWYLSHVKNTKYFQIRSLASDGTHATLVVSDKMSKGASQYMYASTSKDLNDSSYFTIRPQDGTGQSFKFLSKTCSDGKAYMPCI